MHVQLYKSKKKKKLTRIVSRDKYFLGVKIMTRTICIAPPEKRNAHTRLHRLSVELPVCLSACLSVRLSISPLVFLSACLPAYLSAFLLVCLFLFLSSVLSFSLFACQLVNLLYLALSLHFCLSVCLNDCLSPVRLSACLSVLHSACSPVCLSVCPSVCLFFCPLVCLNECPIWHVSNRLTVGNAHAVTLTISLLNSVQAFFQEN
jgi:hypothetical protein